SSRRYPRSAFSIRRFRLEIQGRLRKRRVGNLRRKITPGISGGRDSDLFARTENAVEGEKPDVLQCAERHRHCVINVRTDGDGTMETCQDKNRAADLLSRSKCRTKFQAGRIRRQQ